MNRRRVTVAHAHTGHHAYVFLRAGNRGIFGNVQFPVVDLNRVLDLALPLTKEEGMASLPSVTDPIRRYIETHFSIRVDGSTVSYHLGESRFMEPSVGAYVTTKYRATGIVLSRPALMRVDFDALVDVIPERETMLIVLNSRGFGRFTSEVERRFEMGRGQTSREFVLERPTGPQNVSGTLQKLQRAMANRLGA